MYNLSELLIAWIDPRLVILVIHLIGNLGQEKENFIRVLFTVSCFLLLFFLFFFFLRGGGRGFNNNFVEKIVFFAELPKKAVM